MNHKEYNLLCHILSLSTFLSISSLIHVSAVHFFILFHKTRLYKYTNCCLSIFQFTVIWIASSLGPVWITLLWMFTYESLCRHRFSMSFTSIPRTGTARSYDKYMLNFLKSCQTAFQSGSTIYVHTSNFSISSPILLIACFFLL